eukprot:403344001
MRRGGGDQHGQRYTKPREDHNKPDTTSKQNYSNQHSYQQQHVDREKTCPFLLRIFVKENQTHKLDEFDIDGTVPEKDEIQIYTWMDATLGELAETVRREVESARKNDPEIVFAFVYPDNQGKFRRKEVGVVMRGQRSMDYKWTLQQLRFVIGDYIDLTLRYNEGGHSNRGDRAYNQYGQSQRMNNQTLQSTVAPREASTALEESKSQIHHSDRRDSRVKDDFRKPKELIIERHDSRKTTDAAENERRRERPVENSRREAETARRSRSNRRDDRDVNNNRRNDRGHDNRSRYENNRRDNFRR